MFPVGLNFGVSAIVATPPPVVPPGSTPTGLHAPSIVGNRVTLSWTAPTSVTPTSYAVEGGVSPGQVLASLPTGSPATTFSFDVPTGVYYVRVHALSASGRSFASNEIRISVNLPQLPSPPADLLGLANGANLLLSWRTTYAGGPPASHVLDVSGAATLSVPVPVGETFSYRRCSWGNLHVHGARGEYHRRQRPIGAADAHLSERVFRPAARASEFHGIARRFAADGQLGSAGNRTGGVELRAQRDRCSQPRVASSWPHHQRERCAGDLQPFRAGREPVRVRGSDGAAVGYGAVERTTCRRAAAKAQATSTGSSWRGSRSPTSALTAPSTARP